MASGSADTTVKIWDLNTEKCLHTMEHHRNKVQSIKWHPVEEAVIATASFDKKLYLSDVRDNKISLSRDMTSDVEVLSWHPHDTHLLSVASEDGLVATHDVRHFSGNPLCSFKAHTKATSALTFSSGIKNMCVTASLDQKIKVWNYAQIVNQAPQLVAEQSPGMVLFSSLTLLGRTLLLQLLSRLSLVPCCRWFQRRALRLGPRS